MINPVKVERFTLKPEFGAELKPGTVLLDLYASVTSVLDRVAADAEKYLNGIYEGMNIVRSGFELHGSLPQPVMLENGYKNHASFYPFSFVHYIAGSVFDQWPEETLYLKSLELTLHLALDSELRRLQIEHARDCGRLTDLLPSNQASVSYRVFPHEGFEVDEDEELVPLLLYHGPNYSWYSSDDWDLADSAPFYTPHIHVPHGPGRELEISLRTNC